MGWIAGTVLMLILITVALGVSMFGPAPSPAGPNYRKIARLSIVGVTLFWTLATVMMSAQSVGNGEVGVVTAFGKTDGQILPGVNIVAPWKNVATISTKVQTLHFDGGGDHESVITAFSSETQNVNVKATVNWSVAPNDVQSLYQQVGTNISGLIPSRVKQAFKDATVKYPAVDLAPHREDIRAEVRASLANELSRFSINVVDVNIDDMSFSAQFEAAIEAKQEATQAALKAQQQVQQAKYEAESAVQKAQGEANANVAIATGQAEANRKLAESLSPEILQYLTIQKLASNISVLIVPSSGASLFDLSKLIPATTTKP